MEIGKRPFIIAELSGNAAGDLPKALKMIEVAKDCGCDAVKVQTYKPEDMNDPDNNALYEKHRIPEDWYEHLFKSARHLGIPLFSSVFAPWAVSFLEQFKCPAYKIASPESTRLPSETYWQLAVAIRRTHKTFMASSGRKDMDYIANLAPIVLYCIQGYPAKIDDSDFEFFGNMPAIKTRGFSDHTADITASLAMIAAGARVIEKHFKLDDDCIDAAFSLNPQEMKLLCDIAHR